VPNSSGTGCSFTVVRRSKRCANCSALAAGFGAGVTDGLAARCSSPPPHPATITAGTTAIPAQRRLTAAIYPRPGAVELPADDGERVRGALKAHSSEEELRKVKRYFKSGDDFRIDNWDLVDISAHQVVGAYLADKPRDVLYELARSPNPWERRIAMYATLAFVRGGDLDDTFGLAEILVDDREDLIQKVVGGLLREAGKHDRPRLLAFLDRHAATMPRTALRYAIEHLDKDQKAHYMGLKRAA
jgi:hypothetical protein